MKKIFAIIVTAIVMMTLSTTAFAADTAIGSAVWADENNFYSCDEEGTITVISKEAAIEVAPAIEVEAISETNVFCLNHSKDLVDIGSAIWCDQYATYTADGSDVIMVYFDKEYICGVCHPEVEDTNDGLGSAIWLSPIGTITASGDGVQRIYLNDGYICADCAIGSAIWCDQYATYTADGSGVIKVYFDNGEYVCAKCHPEVVDMNDGIGSAIWLSPIGAITASGDGIQRVYLNDGYICATCAE